MECGKCFSKKEYLTRHFIAHSKIKCLFCQTLFSRADSRQRHMQRLHRKCLLAQDSRKQFSCIHGHYSFKDYSMLLQHNANMPPLPKNQSGGQRVLKKTKQPTFVAKTRAYHKIKIEQLCSREML